ncbi:MAG TPA: hypothetical protein VI612_03655 [Candidatus Nanoarchaeia archaeon]|nr:hypothetical protein [Candidatus Nanoarchaeia archaeon]
MALIDRIKKAVKNLLAGATVTGALTCGAQAKAQDSKPDEVAQGQAEQVSMPARTLFFDFFNGVMDPENNSGSFANPLDGYDLNTKAWYSATQLLGKGSDLLGVKAGLDKGLLARITQLALLGYLNHGTSYYFHEMAHDYEGRKFGLQKHSQPDIDFSDWSKGVPAYVQTGVLPPDPILNEEIYVRNITNGLNQEEFQAHFLYKEQNDKRRVTFDEAVSFLSAKTADIVYLTVANQLKGLSLNETPDYKSIAIYGDDAPYPTLSNQGLWNDIDMYLHHLHRHGIYRIWNTHFNPHTGIPLEFWDPRAGGIELTRKQLLNQFILADALSLRTWESLYAIANYMVTGERSIKPVTIKLGKTEITPTLINHYLTPRGSFYNTNTPINIAGKLPLELNLGHDIDGLLGPGKVRHIRTGARFDLAYVPVDKNGRAAALHLRPFVYFNFDRHAKKYVGYSAGAELSIGVPGAFELMIGLEQNEHDMLENQIKGKEKGLTISAGLKIAY